nr:hypothetical protein CFP56_52285 [Quercus suber]
MLEWPAGGWEALPARLMSASREQAKLFGEVWGQGQHFVREDADRRTLCSRFNTGMGQLDRWWMNFLMLMSLKDTAL